MYKNVLIVELAFQVISAIISRFEIVGFFFFFVGGGRRGDCISKMFTTPSSFFYTV